MMDSAKLMCQFADDAVLLANIQYGAEKAVQS